MRKPSLLFVLATIALLSACAAAPTAPGPATIPQAATTTGRTAIDLSCRTAADCVVKDVGNCCGYYPACVNKDSPTDPAGVQAQCRAQGRISVCGFPSITSCQCHEGRCAPAGSGRMLIEDPVRPPTPVK